MIRQLAIAGLLILSRAHRSRLVPVEYVATEGVVRVVWA